MGSSKRIIKQSIAITCCLLLVIGAGRAMAKDEEGRNDERHVYVEEHDSTARADFEVRETVRVDAGMGRQDISVIEADDREEVPESEPEDTEAESASDGSGRDGAEAEDGNIDNEVDHTDYAVSDMGSTDSSTGWDGWMENDPAVSEYSRADEPGFYDSEYSDSGIYEEPESGVDESGYADTEGEYDSGYESAMPELEIQDTEYEESVEGGWVYYTTALITHYCNCGICCPVAGGTTASGVYPTSGHTVATGDEFPFGTELMINGTVYVVEDRGVGNGCVDIFVDDHQLALNLGMYYTDVYIRG